MNQQEVLPWGEEIPPAALRYFSPCALWTRLVGSDDCDALSIIRNEVFVAFCDYLDLYLEMMNDIKKNNAHVDSHDNSESDSESESERDKVQLLAEECTQGHRDYLDYRMTNDPA